MYVELFPIFKGKNSWEPFDGSKNLELLLIKINSRKQLEGSLKIFLESLTNKNFLERTLDKILQKKKLCEHSVIVSEVVLMM